MDLKERIIQGASPLFFSNGVRSMTMSDVARSLGISKRTLYEAFRDKEELLEACIDAHVKRMDDEMEALAAGPENIIDIVMRMYAMQLREVGDLQRSVVHDLKKYHPALYRKIQSRQSHVPAAFTALLDRGVDEGLIRDDLNFEIMLWLIKAQFKALVEDAFLPTNKYTIDEFSRAILLNFVRGIATPLGNERVDAFMKQMRTERKI
jgi:AcrR family transcriptional regulator